jgi:hypothetical protein
MPENKLKPNFILRGPLLPEPVQLAAVAMLSRYMKLYEWPRQPAILQSILLSLFPPETSQINAKKSNYCLNRLDGGTTND